MVVIDIHTADAYIGGHYGCGKPVVILLCARRVNIFNLRSRSGAVLFLARAGKDVRSITRKSDLIQDLGRWQGE